MTRRILAVLMLLLLAVPFAGHAEEVNLLVNGSFETLDADGLPSGWYPDAYNSREGVTVYTAVTDAKDGAHAARVENVGMNDARFAQNVRVQPNSIYRLSGWIRADQIQENGRGANLSVADIYVFSDSVFDSKGEWVYIETIGRTGPKQKDVTVFARVGGYSGESIGAAAFDDIRLVELEAVPAGATAQRWYKEESVSVNNGAGSVILQGGEDETQPRSAFWPWLLVIGAGYAAAAAWLMRHIQLDRATEMLQQPLGSRRFAMPPYAVAGMLIAAAIRLVVAASVQGYDVDVNCFTAWGSTMARVGPTQFYQSNWCDYTPGYIYVMGLNGLMVNSLNGLVSAAFVHKLVPMACDMIGAWLAYRLSVERGFDRRQGSLLAMLVAFNPAIFLNSAAWCQIDSVLCLGLMLVAYFAIHRMWAAVLPIYVVCALVKPQALMLGFLGLAAIIMELVRNPVTIRESGVKDSVLAHSRTAVWLGRLRFPKPWVDMGIGLVLSLVAALIIIVPFGVGQESGWLIERYSETLGSYPYATVNTANLYYLMDANWQGIASPAHPGAVWFFVLISAAWCVYTFLRRKDREITLTEPLLVAVILCALVMLVLGVLPLMPDAESSLTFTQQLAENLGGSYTLVSGGQIVQVSYLLLLIAGGVFAAAAIAAAVLLNRQDKKHWGLVEPVIMALFTFAFAMMLVFDVTWTTLGVTAMALAFAVVLPMFVRGGRMELLPLCGAVIFLMLYVLGIKMHERYLFPALFLLAMAYALRRDRRILLLLVGATFTLFVNEGIILDNNLRFPGENMGHLNNDTLTLAKLLSTANVVLTLLSVYVCHRICAEDAPVRLDDRLGDPVFPVRTVEETPCTPLTYREEKPVRFTRLDVLLMAVVTLIYSVVTLTTLGSTKAPQTAWKSSTYQEQAVLDLGARYDDFSLLYFCQVSYDNFSVAVSDDGENWSQEYWAQMAEGQCFRWKYLVPATATGDTVHFHGANTTGGVQRLSGRYVRITPHQIGLVINEILFRDAAGNVIPAMAVGSTGANENSPLYSPVEHLVDEPDTLEGEPGWWNSTYFDEIYHARTAFEHLNGTVPYETSHPPLGKVIMSWFVALFGMTPFGWRFAGALAGILMLPAMYLMGKQLTRRTGLAFTAMMLMALDCMHFTQTRIATIDSFPVLFIILSYFFMLRFMQKDIVRSDLKRLLPDLALSGFFMGCGVASKWIGVYAGIGLAILYFWTCLRHLRMGIEAARLQRSGTVLSEAERDTLEKRDLPAMHRVIVLCLWCLLFFVAVPVAIYLLSYIPYFAYKKIDSIITYVAEVIKTQQHMLSYHATPGLGMDHPFYTPWYEWPLCIKPMYYASPAFVPKGWSYALFCFGNPAVWFVGLAGMAYAVYRWVRSHRYRITGKEGTFQLYADTWNVAPAFVIIGMLAQFLPWVLVPRGTYIYHYFASIPFLVLGTVLMLGALWKRNETAGGVVTAVYLTVCLAMFVLLFPYASGVLTPVGWLDFIKDYPWINAYAYESGFLDTLNTLLQRIPLLPNVYY